MDLKQNEGNRENELKRVEQKTDVGVVEKRTDTPNIAMYQDIVDRAHKEVESVRKVYFHLSGLITVLASVAIATFTYSIYKDRQEMRSNMEKEVELIKVKASQDYAQLESNLRLSAQENTHKVETKIGERIDSEFNRENIQGIVTQKARERIDAVADPMIASQIEKKITPQIQTVKKDLHEFKLRTEYHNMAIAAQNDDRFSFQMLQVLAEDPIYLFRNDAKATVNAIISKTKTLYSVIITEYNYPWRDGVDPTKLSLGDLKKQYDSDTLSGYRMALMEYIVDRADISKTEKIGFLSNVLEKETSLDVWLSGVRHFNKFSGQNIDTFNVKKFYRWLEQRQHE